jgi:hypothetical protein
MSYEDALAFSKLKTPEKSEDKNDLDFKSKNITVKKELKDLNEKESLSLNDSEYLEYIRKVKGVRI